MSSYVATSIFVGSEKMFTSENYIEDSQVESRLVEKRIYYLNNNINSNNQSDYYSYNNIVFTTNANSLPINFGNVINNSLIQIIDLPSDISLNEETITQLSKYLIVEVENEDGTKEKALTSTIVASDKIIEEINKVDPALAELITLNKLRNTVVSYIRVNKHYDNQIVELKFDYAKDQKRIDLKASDYFVSSSTSEFAYDYPLAKIADNIIEFENTGNGTIWSYNYHEKDGLPNQDGYLTIDLYYEKSKESAAFKVGENYYLNEIALFVASDNILEDEILTLRDAEINQNARIDSRDKLIIPTSNNLNGELKYVENASSSVSAYRTLKINAILNVNGIISIAGNQSHNSGGQATGYLSGEYGRLEIGENGQIVMKGTSSKEATLIVGGMILGDDSTYQQIIMDEYSSIESRMASKMWYGGTYSSSLNGKNLFPFSDYYIDGLNCNIQFNYGSKLLLHFGVVVSVAGDLNSKLELVSNTSDSLLKLVDSNSRLNLNYKDGKTIVETFGNIELCKMSISLDSLISGGITFDTNTMLLPLNNKFEFFVNDGSTVNVLLGKGVKLLPGSKFVVEKGGTLILNNTNLYVYEWAETPSKNSDSISISGDMGYYEFYDFHGEGVYKYSSINSDGLFINNGRVICRDETNLSGRFLGNGTISVEGTCNANGLSEESFSYYDNGLWGIGAGWKVKTVVKTYVTKDGKTYIPWTIENGNILGEYVK